MPPRCRVCARGGGCDWEEEGREFDWARVSGFECAELNDCNIAVNAG